MNFTNSSDCNYFDGDWIAGKMNYGILFYKNGDSFNGSFKDGRRFKGTLTFANGDDPSKSKEARI
jgi:hypothetical protein